jgi:hypothetical protein
MDNCAARDHQLSFRILWASDAKVLPQIKLWVNP